MPKLTIPQRTYGKAIESLIQLYLNEASFVTKLEKIRHVHEQAVITWLDTSVPNWRSIGLSKDSFYRSGTPEENNTEMLIQFSNAVRQFNDGLNLNEELLEYENELRILTDKWHLKAKWAASAFLVRHFFDMAGITRKEIWQSEGSIEMLEPLLDEAPLPPLIFEVTAYELMYSDQKELVHKFAEQLSDYANRLKMRTWKELPSAIDVHAYWWFEHYVHGKHYKEIAENHKPEVTENSVRQAVARFRKLLAIELP